MFIPSSKPCFVSFKRPLWVSNAANRLERRVERARLALCGQWLSLVDGEPGLGVLPDTLLAADCLTKFKPEGRLYAAPRRSFLPP